MKMKMQQVQRQDSLDSFTQEVFSSGADMLGLVVWHAIRDVRIGEADLAALAAKHGIGDPPTLGHPADAFRRATSSQQRRNEGRTFRLLMRPVLDNAHSIVRSIVAERVDKAGVALAHAELAHMTYDKATKTISHNVTRTTMPLSASESRLLDEMITGCYAEYDVLRQSLTGPEITRFVMRRLDSYSYVSVDPRGGVYFVPAQHAEQVRAIRAFIGDLSAYCVEKGAKHTLGVLPVPDIAEQREMIESGFRSSMEKELDDALADVAEYLARDSKPAPSVIEERLARSAAMRAKAETYANLLGQKFSEAKSRVELLEAQIGELADRASGKKLDPVLQRIRDGVPGVRVRQWSENEYELDGGRGRWLVVKADTRGWLLKAGAWAKDSIGQRPEAEPDRRGFRLRTKDKDVALLAVGLLAKAAAA